MARRILLRKGEHQQKCALKIVKIIVEHDLDWSLGRIVAAPVGRKITFLLRPLVREASPLPIHLSAMHSLASSFSDKTGSWSSQGRVTAFLPWFCGDIRRSDVT